MARAHEVTPAVAAVVRRWFKPTGKLTRYARGRLGLCLPSRRTLPAPRARRARVVRHGCRARAPDDPHL